MTNRKKIFTLALAGLTAMGGTAQSYDRLWKAVNAAMAKDQPRTALTAVEQIRRKALAAGDDGQTLAATLSALWLTDDVTPDSTAAALTRLTEAAAREKRPAVRALWQAAAAKAYAAATGDTANATRARALLRESLRDFDALGSARATDYLPLFVIGRDSRLYDNDVLSIVGRTALWSDILPEEERTAVAKRLMDFYRTKGNRPATLLVTLDSLSVAANAGLLPNSDYRAALHRLTREYADVPAGVETYIALTETPVTSGADDGTPDEGSADTLRLAEAREGLARYKGERRAAVLRNFIAQMEAARYSLNFQRNTVYPGDRLTAQLTGRNLRTVTLTAYRLEGATAATVDDADEAFRRFKRTKVCETSCHFPAATPCLLQRDSLTISLADAGIYVVEAKADGLTAVRRLAYVTRLMPLLLSAGDGQTHVRTVDSKTGAVIGGGRVTAYERDDQAGRRQYAAYDADSRGEITLPDTKGNAAPYRLTYYLTAADDAFSPGFSHYPVGKYVATTERPAVTNLLYTDRGIYRPGQTLAFGGMAYRQQADDVQALSGLQLQVTLKDVNGKEVGRTTCVTDSFGTIHGSFTLPEACLPGTFSLSTDRGGYTAFRVEEYKRPTFSVETTRPTSGYRVGDTVSVTGVVKAYTGVPLPGARVSYTTTVRNSYGYFRTSGRETRAQSGEAVTDSLGRFALPVVLGGKAQGRYWGLIYDVDISVTAENGETITDKVTLSAGNSRSRLSCDWPATVNRDHLPRITAWLTTNDGSSLTVPITWRIKGITATSADTLSSGRGTRIGRLGTLPSGEYDVELTAAGADTVRRHFLVLSDTDVRPAGTTTFWHDVQTSAQGDTARVIVGSPADGATLFYDLFAADRRISSRVVTFSDSLLHFTIPYTPDMGDGARAAFAFVRDGKVYSFTTRVVRPRPDKRLQLAWRTFRSRLEPGQDETWTLSVTYPDGRPADALVMARLYDASLDAFCPSPWLFDLNFNRRLPYLRQDGRYDYGMSWTGEAELKMEKMPALAFTDWNSRFFPHRYRVAGIAGPMFYSLSSQVANIGVQRRAVVKDEADILAGSSVSDRANGASKKAEISVAQQPQAAPRSNFSETAFFRPDLRTDAAGRVSISFTLPQSLTTWNFTALAHTRGMDYGRLDTTAVARKQFMVQPALPRFVRRGDRWTIPVNITNLNATQLNGSVVLTLTDAATGRETRRAVRAFSVKPNGSAVVSFPVDGQIAANCLVARIVGTAGRASDGEEQYIPVLSDRVSVTHSLPFTMTEKGSCTLRLDTLFAGGNGVADRRLTVNLTTNPTWYAVTALPQLAGTTGESVTDAAMRYYAATLSGRIASLNPGLDTLFHSSPTAWANVLQRNAALRQTLLDETPWAAQAATEADRTAALGRLFNPEAVAAARFSAADRLKALQRPDGSFAWYPGMEGSAYVTADVALLLARLEAMGGDDDLKENLDKAIGYLDERMAEAVVQMKKHSTAGLSDVQLRYLYIRALRSMKPDATAHYLLDHCRRHVAEMDLYRKALFAVVLTKSGEREAAAEVIESLKQYTVATPAMGRYFDTRRAAMSRDSYRIPTQTAVIEALRQMPDKAAADMADEMCLWLMQSRRTEMWTNARTTADAVYALLQAAPTSRRLMSLTPTPMPLRYTLTRGRAIVGLNAPGKAEGLRTAGYISDTYTDGKAVGADRLTIHKADSGLSWGSVVAQYTVPAAEAGATASGLAVGTRLEVQRGTAWSPLSPDATPAVGDRVRRVVTVTADRDYDFVSVRLARPACFAPVRPLSGYTCTDGPWAYRAVGDAATSYFVEHLPKGTTTFTEVYAVDRTGRYAAGTVSATCAYAPEFGGQTVAGEVNVK